jgi:hypothetical protein
MVKIRGGLKERKRERRGFLRVSIDDKLNCKVHCSL